MKSTREMEFTEQDLKALAAIKEITAAGDNVEVKRKRDGDLTVYKVRKHIAI